MNHITLPDTVYRPSSFERHLCSHRKEQGCAIQILSDLWEKRAISQDRFRTWHEEDVNFNAQCERYLRQLGPSLCGLYLEVCKSGDLAQITRWLGAAGAVLNQLSSLKEFPFKTHEELDREGVNWLKMRLPGRDVQQWKEGEDEAIYQRILNALLPRRLKAYSLACIMQLAGGLTPLPWRTYQHNFGPFHRTARDVADILLNEPADPTAELQCGARLSWQTDLDNLLLIEKETIEQLAKKLQYTDEKRPHGVGRLRDGVNRLRAKGHLSEHGLALRPGALLAHTSDPKHIPMACEFAQWRNRDSKRSSCILLSGTC